MNTNREVAKSHQEFIQVIEAYQILSKAHCRANYDLSLREIDYIRKEPWKMNSMSYDENSYSPYYGVKGMKRIKNWKIVAACVLFCVFGALIQGFAIFRTSAIYRREETNVKSDLNSAKYEEARANAVRNGNVLQLEMMERRLVKSTLDINKAYKGDV